MIPMSHEIASAMIEYGGSFASGLARLWMIADADNRLRIETTWQDYIDRYAEFVMHQENQTNQ